MRAVWMTDHGQRTGPETGFLRLRQIIGPSGPIPVSKTTWWEGVRRGRFPPPIKITAGVTAWRRSDIDALVEHLSRGTDGKELT